MAANMQQTMPEFDPNSADAHLARLLAPSVEEPWYHSLLQSVKDLVRPPVLPPLVVTSKPIAVKDIWGLYGKDKRSNMMSLAIHGTAILLLFTVASSKTVQMKAKEAFSTLIAPDIAPTWARLRNNRWAVAAAVATGLPCPLPKASCPSLP